MNNIGYKRFIKTLCTLLLLVACFLPTVSAFAASTGVQLALGYVVQVNKVKCGYIKGKWIPGSVLKNGNFLSLSEKISGLNKQIKNKKTKSAVKAKLRAQVDSLKKTQSKNAKFCKGLLKPTGVIPTPIPTIIATPIPQITPATPLPGATTVAWNVDATSIANNVGVDYLYFCPANPTDSFRSIYGTDTYTTDSPICVAALHLGLFKRAAGGNVKFRIKGSQSLFIGSLRNDIQSSFYGSYPHTYVFLDLGTGQELITNTVPTIPWSQTASPLYTLIDSQFTFFCPAAPGESRSIWGTSVYTYDSSICMAAVHAGRITKNQGGVVVIQIKPGATAYVGSTQNGVTSQSYGSWGGSYIFVP